MKWPVEGIFAIAALAVLLAGCNRDQSQNQAEPALPVAQAPPPAPQPPPPVPIPPATELPLNTVDSVMLSRPLDEPMAVVIHVSGTALSPGWTDVKLTEEPNNDGDASVKTYKFVATSPEMPDENRNVEPIEAEIRVDSFPPEVTTIRIVSATNEVSAPIAQ